MVANDGESIYREIANYLWKLEDYIKKENWHQLTDVIFHKLYIIQMASYDKHLYVLNLNIQKNNLNTVSLKNFMFPVVTL